MPDISVGKAIDNLAGALLIVGAMGAAGLWFGLDRIADAIHAHRGCGCSPRPATIAPARD